MEATNIHASALAIVASKSLASRRQRPSQAKVRSTTHRCGRTSKPCHVGALDDFDGPRVQVGQGLRQFFSGIAAVGE